VPLFSVRKNDAAITSLLAVRFAASSAAILSDRLLCHR
jgi:hypothetical protein